jgi:uncharacterized protein YukE
MSLKSLLLKIARKILQEVISTITKQMNIVQQQGEEVLRGFTKTIMDGAWVGPAADEFVDELSNMVIPKVNTTHSSINNLVRGIERALNTIEQADKTAADMVGDLDSLFSKIY